MAQRKLTMRKSKEILRLKWKLGLSDRQVAASLRIAHSTVAAYVRRAEEAGLDWEQIEGMGETELKTRLFPPPKPKKKRRPQPDWKWVDKEMRKPQVTRKLLWTEYIAEHPDGYGYSQFCELYRRWAKSQKKSPMRRPKKAGEEVQVDYAGQKVPIVDPETGEFREAEIFIGVLGASGLIYAEAQWSQSLPNWTRAHVRMFDYFGGVPKLVIPDNLKSGVTKANFYDPDLNPTYHEMAVHYGVAVLPTRVREPRDYPEVLQIPKFLITVVI